MKKTQQAKHFECDMVVSLEEGVCLLRSDTKQWEFRRRLRNGRVVPAQMPPRVLKIAQRTAASR